MQIGLSFIARTTRELLINSEPVISVASKEKSSCPKIKNWLFGKLADSLRARKSIGKIIDCFQNFGITEYESLAQYEKNYIRRLAKTAYKELGNDLKVVKNSSSFFKEHFDKIYGEGNYVFVSVGRSLSPNAEALKTMGVTSHSIPISGMGGTVKPKVREIKTGINEYKQYLESVGLDANTISKSNKHYLFCDYTASGSSLKSFEEFIKSSEVGINSANVHIVNINDVLLHSDVKVRGFNPKEYIDSYLSGMLLKGYSSTPKLDYRNLTNIKNAVKEPQGLKSKIFNFCLIDKPLIYV